MRVVNAAKHVAAEVTFSTNKHARTSLLVVFKATYSIPANGRIPRPIIPPQPLAVQDQFYGDAGFSAPVYENDFAASKHMCDVVFNACAHTPNNQPCPQLEVGVRVGTMSKTLTVFGDRVWEKDLFLVRASRPRPFLSMPLHYGKAFGGTHKYMDGERERWDTFASNPFGCGYAGTANTSIHTLLMPNLELPGKPIRMPQRGTPAALSPVPRTIPSRLRYAGTYDQNWRENIAPFLPSDFDESFFQCVPEDQQIPFPVGGEEVVLLNMMQGRPEVRFQLPRLDVVPVRVLHRDYRVSEPTPHVDTLFFEPDANRFSVVWRSSVQLGVRGAHEVRLVAIGQVCERWWEGVRNGGMGCQGCKAKVQFSHEKTSSSQRGELIPASPEFCPDTPEHPAKDPISPMPTVRLVVTGTDEPESSEEKS